MCVRHSFDRFSTKLLTIIMRKQIKSITNMNNDFPHAHARIPHLHIKTKALTAGCYRKLMIYKQICCAVWRGPEELFGQPSVCLFINHLSDERLSSAGAQNTQGNKTTQRERENSKQVSLYQLHLISRMLSTAEAERGL